MPSLRLLTYNVRSMRDDRDALGRVIRAAAPDVVLVQESPRFARWRSLCAELARRGNLVVVSGGRPAGSNLILSSLAVDVHAHAEVLLSKDRRLHQRGTAIAVLSLGGTRFAVAGIHLDLVEAPRLRHVAEVESALARHVPADVPVIIAGDVNDRPGSPTWRALARGRQDAIETAGLAGTGTWSAQDPQQTIDGAFVDERVRVKAVRIIDGADVKVASDHRPVLVELEI